jgi:hypothetical protein
MEGASVDGLGAIVSNVITERRMSLLRQLVAEWRAAEARRPA